MLLDGYIIKVDYTEQKKLEMAIGKIGTNINQICRRFNSTNSVYQGNIEELKEL